jgi:hypothetical protein
LYLQRLPLSHKSKSSGAVAVSPSATASPVKADIKSIELKAYSPGAQALGKRCLDCHNTFEMSTNEQLWYKTKQLINRSAVNSVVVVKAKQNRPCMAVNSSSDERKLNNSSDY